jgi:hypothetical protein
MPLAVNSVVGSSGKFQVGRGDAKLTADTVDHQVATFDEAMNGADGDAECIGDLAQAEQTRNVSGVRHGHASQ